GAAGHANYSHHSRCRAKLGVHLWVLPSVGGLVGRRSEAKENPGPGCSSMEHWSSACLRLDRRQACGHCLRDREPGSRCKATDGGEKRGGGASPFPESNAFKTFKTGR